MATTQIIKEKRRGRPPKNLVPPKPIKETTTREQTEEQLVLYLPNFDDGNEENNFDTMSDSDTDVEQSIKTEKKEVLIDNMNTLSTKKSSLISKLNLNKTDTKITHLTDKVNGSDDESTDKIDKIITTKKVDYKNISMDKLIDELNRRESLIMMLKTKLKDKNLYNDNTITLTKDNKKKLLNLGLISINKNKLQIAEKTNIACWWCTYEFDTCPCFLPDHYKNNRYYVFGNFCGFSCMLAYNENLDDYRKSIRSVLIKQMYRDIFQNNNIIIKPAGPRELLQKFGGPLDISQYRDPNTICTKTFKMTIPPMIPLISEYEEVVIDK